MVKEAYLIKNGGLGVYNNFIVIDESVRDEIVRSKDTDNYVYQILYLLESKSDLEEVLMKRDVEENFINGLKKSD